MTKDEMLELERQFNECLAGELQKKRAPMVTVDPVFPDGSGWISCRKKLPAHGQDVILFFHDTFHMHPSWPDPAVQPAWRANVGEPESPDGIWAIEGRLGNYCVDIQDGIAWMPLPDPPAA